MFETSSKLFENSDVIICFDWIIFWKGKTCFASIDNGDAIICFDYIIFQTCSKLFENNDAKIWFDCIFQQAWTFASFLKGVWTCFKKVEKIPSSGFGFVLNLV